MLEEQHKSHEIIATQKGFEAELETLARRHEEALILKERLRSLKLGLDGHLDDLRARANTQRQDISQVYSQVRRLLQERETELKKGVTQALEQEESRLKDYNKALRH